MSNIIATAVAREHPLKQALWYRKHLGWSVFPVHGVSENGNCTCGNPKCDRPAKHAVIKWEAYQKAPPSLEQVQADFEHRPWANIGLATGAWGVVLDVDAKDDGHAELAELLIEHGALPDTVESLTGGGGRHVFFQHPGFPIRNRAKMRPGLDFRGDGGYVVIPVSKHISGRDYLWETSCRPDEVQLAPMPEWLIKLVTATASTDMAHGDQGGTDWSMVVLEGAPEGARNDTTARLAGRLLRHGFPPPEAFAWMQLWNKNLKEPLGDDELFRTVKSIAQREAAVRLERRRPRT